MSERTSFDIREMHMRKREQQGGKCYCCGECVNTGQPQLAHLIPKSAPNLAKYGKAVIHHDLNQVLTCSLVCNNEMDKGILSTIEVEEIAEKIRRYIIQDGICQCGTNLIRQNMILTTRIPVTETMRKIIHYSILDHDLNKAVVCCGSCAGVLDLGVNIVTIYTLVNKIRAAIAKGE